MDTTNKNISEYNAIIKENEDVYRGIAKAFGLSDCTFWILYTLREVDEKLTQSDICEVIYLPKQTVNSALKKLENSGHIKLAPLKDRRSKEITLTKSGIDLAEKTVDKVIAVENKAFAGLGTDEQSVLISLFRKYTDLLKESIGALKAANGETK
ncbi:MAG: MarR family transcriptional regulator [Bacillota bacterium]|nr:MarR family transcriptional regulator [Bacillota bacterium]